jgi:hypothetical protein
MSSPQNVKLTSAEMASLWNSYINHTHSQCILTYFIAKVEDPEVETTLKNTLQVVENLITTTKQLLTEHNIPIPTGFGSQDVDTTAPKLFSDSLALMYIKNLARVMVSACSLMFTMSTRKDIRSHFHACLAEATKVFGSVSDVLLNKGIYVRPPFIEAPKENDYIESKEYISGNNLFQDRRNLNAVEISHVFGNIEANVIGNAITKGFGQTADREEVRDFMEKSNKLSEKIVNSLTKFLTDSSLPAPMPSDMQVFSSTHAPFSDNFMMYEIGLLMGAGISDYATSISATMRNDVRAFYMDTLTDTAKLAKKAEKLMIAYRWIEQPPQQDKVVY